MAIPKKEKWYRKLRHKYRLVIFHDETFEEKISFRLSRLNVFVTLVSLMVVLVFVTSYIIAFTSLREYIPGYTDIRLNQRIYDIESRADSLERVFQQKDRYIANIKRIVEGYDAEQDSLDAIGLQVNTGVSAIDTIDYVRSEEDSLLRLEFESAERFNLYDQNNIMPESQRRTMKVANFFIPLKGTITNPFDPLNKHFGVDIVAKSNDAVKATLEGTVIFASWTPDKGYILGVQHGGNFFSVYKHNAVLLKKEGDFVKAGEAIAIVGDSGELSTGPHLHFELWFNGVPINPTEYLSF
ncbi:MAG: M23 family metallopeptidase [Bacteroidetes bacterium]|jgi:murein DD-endopeptidase MepM/ murein hydrolase activator NlpD|nr:M23 family metallopeptidase [Bacteroidota bacterium]MBU1578308.1 M23 family metallopeptidase [Bacteroidota bacterium]MBU2558252.1 M23 family metallopeptidase [Bacteroidota bacterium]MDA3942029.1 M23 family metallopeptidase [Bacteroidota bacterium]